MANFFLDNKDLQFHMNHPLMKKIVELKEKGYADKDAYDYAPVDFEDAQDSYRRVSSSVEQMEGVAQKQNNYLQTVTAAQSEISKAATLFQQASESI